jgi:hypothetical protein
VFKSSILKILSIVLFLKIMLSMDFNDFFIPQIVSLLLEFSRTPAAHLKTLRFTQVENRWPTA